MTTGTHGSSSAAQSCSGLGIDLAAPVLSRGDVLVRAPLATVFALQTDIDRWTTWRSDVASAERLDDGPLRAGSRFRWSTAGLEVESRVQQVEPERCTFWGGPAGGIVGLHLWTYRQTPDGVLVHTEESWSGGPVEADVAGAQAALDASLETWRTELARAAEARG